MLPMGALRSARRLAEVSMTKFRAVAAGFLDAGYAPNFAAEGEPPNISLTGVTISYRSTVAVEAVSGAFPPRSMTAIVGPNGAGKSTLLKAVAGMLQPQSGTLCRGREGPADIAYLPQSGKADRHFPVSVIEFVALGGWRRFGAFRPVQSILPEAATTLVQVGLADVSRRPIAELSEGQFRRALFARMVLQRARVLLLDEPFSAIDEATTADLVQLVKLCHDGGCTIIAIMHDLSLVRNHFPLTLLLARRVISWGATGQVLCHENLAQAGFASSSHQQVSPG
jgi:zinc/manganese transport system ATP-binding protein